MNKLFGLDVTKYSMKNTVYVKFWRYGKDGKATLHSFPVKTRSTLRRLQRLIPPKNVILRSACHTPYEKGEYISVDFILDRGTQ
jgi:hypothetical protein